MNLASHGTGLFVRILSNSWTNVGQSRWKQTVLKLIIARMKPHRVFHCSHLPESSAALPGLMLRWIMCTSPLLQMLSAWGFGKWVVTNSARQGGGTSSRTDVTSLCAICVTGVLIWSEGIRVRRRWMARCVHKHPSRSNPETSHLNHQEASDNV